MNEKLKIYDEKMQKTIHALDTELLLSVQDVQTRIF